MQFNRYHVETCELLKKSLKDLNGRDDSTINEYLLAFQFNNRKVELLDICFKLLTEEKSRAKEQIVSVKRLHI